MSPVVIFPNCRIAVINYLVEKEGVSSDRFIFRYGQSVMKRR